MPTLLEKIQGCNAAAVVSNSMGDVTEGKSHEQIKELYGFVDTLLAQDKRASVRERDWGAPWVRHAHHRPPGMTEDGIERHRLMCTAIIEKGGRITVWDLARIWVRDINPEHFGYLLGNQDRGFYELLKAGMPPPETGRYAQWPGFIGTAKMMLPVGLINACDPYQAARDALDLGRLKDTDNRPLNYALEVCAGLAAACAEAMRPQASIESIVAAGLHPLSSTPRAAAEGALQWAEEADEVWDLRPLFAEKYRGHPTSNAVEVFSAGLAIFSMVSHNTRDAILAGVNFGRDCDCISYVAAGLAGALNGIDTVPAEWIEIVEAETKIDPYTVSRRSLADTAQGLYEALLNETNRARARIVELEEQISHPFKPEPFSPESTKEQDMSANGASASLTQAIKELAIQAGAVLVGVAPIERFDPLPPYYDRAPKGHDPRDFVPDAKSVISFAQPVLNAVMDAPAALLDQEIELVPPDVKQGYLETLYHVMGHRVQDYMLEQISQKLGQHLLLEGFETMIFPTTGIHPRPPQFGGGGEESMSERNIWNGPGGEWAKLFSPFGHSPGPFSHRHAATRAGLGEFGYNNIVLTPEFGARQRFSSIITDAKLVPDPLIDKPICLRDSCLLCMKACYMGVITFRDDPKVRDYRSVDVVHKDVIFIDTPTKSDPRLCSQRRHRMLNPPVRGDCARICPLPQEKKRLPKRLQALVQEWRETKV